jgi:hypothetical protein
MFAFLSFLIAVVALSFVCFGLVLVAIGWLYQRILWFSRGGDVCFPDAAQRAAVRC